MQTCKLNSWRGIGAMFDSVFMSWLSLAH